MYAEPGLLFPYLQSYSQDFQQLEEYCKYQEDNASMSNLISSSSISEYDLGGEGDLFKAPELIIEEPIMGLDPMTAAISMISCGEEVLTPSGLKMAAGLEDIQNEQLLSDVFYECKKDLMEMAAAIDSPLSDILDIKTPLLRTEENHVQDHELAPDLGLSKSVSSGCLSAMDWIPGGPVKPSFLDFPGIDFTAAYGMRRAFSEGDIKALGNGNVGHIHSPRPLLISSNSTSEARLEKLSRYRNKKNKRNFGRKIKYACRKALADSQPRVRGRFAKTEESDGIKGHQQ
ncbi:unnamed protein product [Linum trigynum]|uniref:CCT domain-containing protein n=1 Tax=Linum trigynum TaxID=586398 RepID=A0AAV2GG78_9ROSI